MELEQLLTSVTPQIHENLKRAVERGKWPNGRPLTEEQRELCMQAIIVYDARNKPEEERVGYIPPKDRPSPCDSKKGNNSGEEPIKWQDG